VLGQAGLLKKWNGKPSKKGTGFEQPPQAHQHWHIDVSYKVDPIVKTISCLQ
jgi:putative transposase